MPEQQKTIQITTDIIRAQLSEELDKRGFNSPNRQIFLEDHVRSLVIRLEATIQGLPGEREEWVVSYPQNWWEGLKERWLPDWLMRRYPIRYTHERKSIQTYKAVCPHLPTHGEEYHVTWFLRVRNNG